MSSFFNRLVSVLDGTNYCDWSVLMQSYLQLNDLWEVVDGNLCIPEQPQPTTRTTGTGDQAWTMRVPIPEDQIAVYNAAYAIWSTTKHKAIGAITLRIVPQLRYHQTVNQSAWTFGGNLRTAFSAASMSTVYSDFKQIINTKLSGGNPVSEIERMAELFGRLLTNNLNLPKDYKS